MMTVFFILWKYHNAFLQRHSTLKNDFLGASECITFEIFETCAATLFTTWCAIYVRCAWRPLNLVPHKSMETMITFRASLTENYRKSSSIQKIEPKCGNILKNIFMYDALYVLNLRSICFHTYWVFCVYQNIPFHF